MCQLLASTPEIKAAPFTSQKISAQLLGLKSYLEVFRRKMVVCVLGSQSKTPILEE